METRGEKKELKYKVNLIVQTPLGQQALTTYKSPSRENSVPFGMTGCTGGGGHPQPCSPTIHFRGLHSDKNGARGNIILFIVASCV